MDLKIEASWSEDKVLWKCYLTQFLLGKIAVTGSRVRVGGYSA